MRRFTWKVRVFLLSKDLRDHALIFPSDSDGRAQLFDVLCFKASERVSPAVVLGVSASRSK